ncbi:MAG: hypothetical protein E2O61_14075 [Gammaproteobacteria bacterium]|nr:MAG: hypothetical protein E2O59_13915 [Gammaproteobacteria bacterium]TDJ32349.1 MAG: hypothetical protein E2O61_14075 [Gammaproteobacteria bacterium]
MDGPTLLWGLLFSSIGVGYFVYGRKQRKLMPFVSGVGLILAPMFVYEVGWLLGLGAALLVLPLLIKN